MLSHRGPIEAPRLGEAGRYHAGANLGDLDPIERAEQFVPIMARYEQGCLSGHLAQRAVLTGHPLAFLSDSLSA